MLRLAGLFVITVTLLGCRSGESDNLASDTRASADNQNATATRSLSSASKGADPEDKIGARAILKELRVIEQQGRSMQSLRNARDPEKARECDDLKRQRQQAARNLMTRAERLAPRYGSMLAVAARELTNCVSCIIDAIENCEVARRSLSRAESALK